MRPLASPIRGDGGFTNYNPIGEAMYDVWRARTHVLLDWDLAQIRFDGTLPISMTQFDLKRICTLFHEFQFGKERDPDTTGLIYSSRRRRGNSVA